jgi:hypothetical protein
MKFRGKSLMKRLVTVNHASGALWFRGVSNQKGSIMLLDKFVLSATLAALVVMTSNAYAAVVSYDVSATYNSGGGSVTGSFTLDTTLDTVTAIDLTVTPSGYFLGFTDSKASDFGFSQFTGTGTLK